MIAFLNLAELPVVPPANALLNDYTFQIKGKLGGIQVKVIDNGGSTICDGNCSDSQDSFARIAAETITAVHQFFHEVFKLNGIDGKGNIVPVRVHWDRNNAAWFCRAGLEGCVLAFNDDYVKKREVFGHEYMHGVVAHLKPLDRNPEQRALNESIADVFGLIFKRWDCAKNNIKCDDLWIIADRNLTTYASIDSYKRLIEEAPDSLNDYGYVHANSIIPSHAFYTALRLVKKEYYNAVSQIWWRAFTSIQKYETFQSFAIKTILQAETDHKTHTPCDSYSVLAAVHRAWLHVGVIQFGWPFYRSTTAVQLEQISRRLFAIATAHNHSKEHNLITDWRIEGDDVSAHDELKEKDAKEQKLVNYNKRNLSIVSHAFYTVIANYTKEQAMAAHNIWQIACTRTHALSSAEAPQVSLSVFASLTIKLANESSKENPFAYHIAARTTRAWIHVKLLSIDRSYFPNT